MTRYVLPDPCDEVDKMSEFHPESQEILMMTPDEFLLGSGLSSEHLFISIKSDLVVLDLRDLSYRLIYELPLDPPWLEWNTKYSIWHRGLWTNRHEGRHRATAAKLAGLKSIPVRIFYRHGDEYINVPDTRPVLLQKLVNSSIISL